MTKNKEYCKQLESQHRALDEHLQKIAGELSRSSEQQRQGLVAKWEETVAVCRQQIAKLNLV